MMKLQPINLYIFFFVLAQVSSPLTMWPSAATSTSGLILAHAQKIFQLSPNTGLGLGPDAEEHGPESGRGHGPEVSFCCLCWCQNPTAWSSSVDLMWNFNHIWIYDIICVCKVKWTLWNISIYPIKSGNASRNRMTIEQLTDALGFRSIYIIVQIKMKCRASCWSLISESEDQGGTAGALPLSILEDE